MSVLERGTKSHPILKEELQLPIPITYKDTYLYTGRIDY